MRTPPLAVVDGQPVNVATLPDAVAKAVQRARAGRAFTLFTLNLDHLVKRRRDERFRQAYERATFVTADGAPVAALARRQGAALSRATGADLVLPLCRAAASEGLPVFLLGSSPQVLERAAEVLRRRCPGLDVRGMRAPRQGFDPLSTDADAAGVHVLTSGAKLCFVALGAPKQELFADRMVQRGWPIGWVCVGAALDFLAGEHRRAPRAFQAAGAEWVWRLFSDPRRLAVRYARCAWLFVGLLAGGSHRPVVDQPGAA